MQKSAHREYIYPLSLRRAGRAWRSLSTRVLSHLQSKYSPCRPLGVLQMRLNPICTSVSEELPRPHLANHRLCTQQKQNTPDATTPLVTYGMQTLKLLKDN